MNKIKGINLVVIREWPEGFKDRLQEVWIDTLGCIPNVKLHDLQTLLDQYGYEMIIKEKIK